MAFLSSGELYALTDNEAGVDLPADLGPWTMSRSVTLQAHDPDEQTAISLIRAHGFCCFE